MEKSLVKTYKATEVFAPLVRIAKECFDTECLYKMITVYVVRMPLNMGGGTLGVTWSIEEAQKLVKAIRNSKDWSREMEFRAEMNMTPPGEHVIEETFISALTMIGE